MTDPNLPPGTTDRDTDAAQGFGNICPECGAFDCPDHAGVVDEFEYDSRFDDEGD